MSAPDNLILVEDHGDHAVLRINRADKRNAMNSAARRCLRESLRALNGTHKVIVITGSGESFCSGMDLKELTDTTEARAEAGREWIEALLDIRRHPAIVIAAVNGFALGGGVSLIHVSDLAIAADEAEIGMPEMGFGTYPAMAGPATQLMLTPKRSAWMVLTARRVNGQTAERWGVVNSSVPRAQLDDEAHALARHVAQFDSVALAESKRALDLVPNRVSDWPSAFDFGQAVNVEIRAKTSAQRDGLARFARGESNPGQGKVTARIEKE
jgi:enoyl-CoA hydratase/carnithine racemase